MHSAAWWRFVFTVRQKPDASRYLADARTAASRGTSRRNRTREGAAADRCGASSGTRRKSPSETRLGTWPGKDCPAGCEDVNTSVRLTANSENPACNPTTGESTGAPKSPWKICRLAGIVPETVSRIKETKTRYNLRARLLPDSQMSAARVFRIACEVDQETLVQLKSHRVDLEAASGGENIKARSTTATRSAENAPN